MRSLTSHHHASIGHATSAPWSAPGRSYGRSWSGAACRRSRMRRAGSRAVPVAPQCRPATVGGQARRRRGGWTTLLPGVAGKEAFGSSDSSPPTSANNPRRVWHTELQGPLVAAGPAIAPSPAFSSAENQSYPERTRLTLIRTTHSRPVAITWCGALAEAHAVDPVAAQQTDQRPMRIRKIHTCQRELSSTKQVIFPTGGGGEAP
jgi:hypothetical protein